MKLSSDIHLKHEFGPCPFSSVRLLLELCRLNGDLLWRISFLCCLNHSPAGFEPPQWLHLDWKRFSLYIFITVLSKFKSSNYKADINIDFWSIIFLLLYILLAALLYENSTFRLNLNCLRKCSSGYIQYNYFPLKLLKP